MARGQRLGPSNQLVAFAILLHVAVLVLQPASAAVLASSSLETCTQSTLTDVSCQKKIVMTVSVGNGQNIATQDLQFQLSCVGSSSGICPCPCNYALDSSCTCRDLASPLSVSLTKTPVWAGYPLQYLQSYNYKPYEVVVRPSSRVCTDGEYDPDPTCGWYYVRGSRVTDSQGFTCSCSSSQIFDTTFGGSNQRTRANLDCDFWSDPLDILMGKVPCSAHCLQFNSLWYSAYQLGAASMLMSIDINVQVPTNTNSSTQTSASSTVEVLKLSPSLPLAVTTSRLVSAQLLGDLATYTQLPALSNQILLVPQPSGSTPDQILAINRTQWLLVDTSMISSDGSTCDRIGTSFSAFRFQAAGCTRAPQVCLGNQIKDLIDADSQRVQAGKVPLYMVTRYTYGAESSLMSVNAGPISFAIPVTSTSTSLVVLSVSADSVRLVTNVATGVISSMQLCTFAAVTCGGFEAAASRGYVWLNLTNTGSLAADFTITIGNCSTNVLPIEARTISLAPGQPTLITPPFTLYVSDTSADPERYCWVTLYDSQGLVSDRGMLKFFTNATIFTEKPTGGYNGSGDGVGTAKGAVDCKKVCTNAIDILCFVANGCWGKLGGVFGILAGVVGVAALLAFAAKAGLIASLFSSLANQCGGGGGGGDRTGGNTGTGNKGDANKDIKQNTPSAADTNSRKASGVANAAMISNPGQKDKRLSVGPQEAKRATVHQNPLYAASKTSTPRLQTPTTKQPPSSHHRSSESRYPLVVMQNGRPTMDGIAHIMPSHTRSQAHSASMERMQPPTLKQ